MMPSDPASAPRVDAPLPNTPSHARPKDAWKAEAQKPSFGKAIDQNLDALSKTIDAHKDFDAEFLRILQKDIDMLGEVYQERHEPLDSYLWTELRQKNTRLSEIAARAQSSASAGLKEGNENIPLVGAMDDPKNLERAGLLSGNESWVTRGLKMLSDGGYRVRRVRGNGHCLFSSIATHLMSTERLVALQKRLPGAEDQRIIGLSIQQLKEGKSVEAILQDEAMYASWVKLLRIRAVEWWGKKIHESGEKLEGLALAAREAIPELRDNSNDREVCDQYLRTMSAMVEIKYGGSPEIQALEGVLGMSIHPVDLKQIAELGLSRVPPPSSADHDVWILYKGSHFDSLLPPIAIP